MNLISILQMADLGEAKVGGQGEIIFEICKIKAKR